MMFWIYWRLLVWFIVPWLLTSAQNPPPDDYFSADDSTTYQDEIHETTDVLQNVLNQKCEGETVNVRCRSGQTISWISAKYKTLDTTHTCMDHQNSAISSALCQPKNSLQVVQQHCGDSNECSFMVNDAFFKGDPCYEAYTYGLEVTYTCNEMNATQIKFICENRNQPLRCNQNDHLDIRSALFRTTANQFEHEYCVASSQAFFPDCSKNVSTDVRKTCNGNAICTLKRQTETYGDPCADKFNSYFEFQYSCADNSNGNNDIGCPCTKGITEGGNYSCTRYSCDIPTKCPAEYTRNTISWPETYTNNVATVESNERCPVDTENRHLGLANRQCIYDEENGAQWGEITHEYCGKQQKADVQDLSKTPVTLGNVQEVADALFSAIDNDNKNAENIDIGHVQITLDNIVKVGSPSPNVTEGVVKAVNSVLSANISKNVQDSANASSEIIRSVEKQVYFTVEEYGNFRSIKPNIVVEGVIETQVSDGIGFAISQTNEGFEEESSGIFDPNGVNQTSGSSIQVPKDALFEDGEGTGPKLSFIGYNDGQLFQSQNLDELNVPMIVGPIISAVVLDKDVVNLTNPVIIQIDSTQGREALSEAVLNTSKCVYWDFSKRNGIGDWAENGCELMSTESGIITCHCNHLTNFAVLVDFSGQHGKDSESGTLNFVLDIISKVGCAFSIVGLCLTLMIFLCCKGLRISLQRKILIQFCISMLGLYLTFLIGIDSTHSKSGCIIAAALLHYFVVSTVLWMGVEARHMYITLVSESDRVGRKFMIKAGCFSWGVGLIPVAVVLAITQHDYLAPSYCFVAVGYGLFLGLLLPVGLVLLHNTITFGLVATTLLKSRAYVKKSDLEKLESENGDVEDCQATGASDVSQRLLNAFAVSILFGMTWVFGFLAIEEAQMIFQLLFCICNSFQGFLIFILFCYGQKDVRKLICARCFAEPPSQPNVRHTKKPAAKGVTAVSGDTRVTGESYTEDNATLVTNINGMTMTVLESEMEESNGNQLEQLNKSSYQNKVTQPFISDKSDDKDEVMLNRKETTTRDRKQARVLEQKDGYTSEPDTEQTDLSATSETG